MTLSGKFQSNGQFVQTSLCLTPLVLNFFLFTDAKSNHGHRLGDCLTHVAHQICGPVHTSFWYLSHMHKSFFKETRFVTMNIFKKKKFFLNHL